MSSIGVMSMPVDFRYREVFLKGRPRHDRYDPFRIRHPSMDRGHRAKIFSPFDALNLVTRYREQIVNILFIVCSCNQVLISNRKLYTLLYSAHLL